MNSSNADFSESSSVPPPPTVQNASPFQSQTSIPPRTFISRGVPAFLNKLYIMVNDPETDPLIHWSESGASFLVLHHELFAKHVLPKFFKHNNFSSFVRQLNMYGFHKVPHLQQGVLQSDKDSEIWEFSNSHFLKNQPDLLYLLTRKKHKEANEPETGNMDLLQFSAQISAIKQHQHKLSAELQNIQKEQKLIWNETSSFNEKFNRQQDTIEKILRFLASVYVHKEREDKSIVPKKRRLLLEEGNSLISSPYQPSDATLYPDSNELLSLGNPLQQSLITDNNPTSVALSNLEPLGSRINDAGKLFMDINENLDTLNLNREALASVLGIDPTCSMEKVDVNDLFQFNDDQHNQNMSFTSPTNDYFLNTDSPISSLTSTPISPLQHFSSTPPPGMQSPTPNPGFDSNSMMLPFAPSTSNSNIKLKSSFVEDDDGDLLGFPSLDVDYGDSMTFPSP